MLLERFQKDYINHTYAYSFRKVGMKICMEVTRKTQTVELVQPLWKPIERFLKEEMLCDLDIVLYGIHQREIKSGSKSNPYLICLVIVIFATGKINTQLAWCLSVDILIVFLLLMLLFVVCCCCLFCFSVSFNSQEIPHQ